MQPLAPDVDETREAATKISPGFSLDLSLSSFLPDRRDARDSSIQFFRGGENGVASDGDCFCGQAHGCKLRFDELAWYSLNPKQ